MLRKGVTWGRIQKDNDGCNRCYLCLGIVIGMFMVFCITVSQGVHAHTISLVSQGKAMIELVPCNKDMPPSGLVALEGCQVQLPEDAVRLNFEGFDEVLPENLIDRPVMSKRLQVWSYNRRRAGGWSKADNAGGDDNVKTTISMSDGVLVGPFQLGRLINEARKASEEKVMCTPMEWQQHGQDPPVKSDSWFVPPKYSQLSMPCQEDGSLVLDDTKVDFWLANASALSIIGEAVKLGGGPLSLESWRTRDDYVPKVSVVKSGSVTPDAMWSSLAAEDQSAFVASQIIAGSLFAFAVLMSLWPKSIRCCCESGVNFEIGEFCSSFFRAALFGSMGAALASLAGWVAFQYGAVPSCSLVLVMLLGIFLEEGGWSLLHDSHHVLAAAPPQDAEAQVMVTADQEPAVMAAAAEGSIPPPQTQYQQVDAAMAPVSEEPRRSGTKKVVLGAALFFLIALVAANVALAFVPGGVVGIGEA